MPIVLTVLFLSNYKLTYIKTYKLDLQLFFFKLFDLKGIELYFFFYGYKEFTLKTYFFIKFELKDIELYFKFCNEYK